MAKSSAPPKPVSAKETKGQKAGEQMRQIGNTLTDQQRDDAINVGMAMIYAIRSGQQDHAPRR